MHQPRVEYLGRELPALSFPIKCEARKGITFYLHVSTEGYFQGYISDILDLYTPDLFRGIWVFQKRIRKHRKPLHEGSIGFNTPCKQCAKFYLKYPKTPKDEILLKPSK